MGWSEVLCRHLSRVIEFCLSTVDLCGGMTVLEYRQYNYFAFLSILVAYVTCYSYVSVLV